MSWFGLVIVVVIFAVVGRAAIRAYDERFDQWRAAAAVLGIQGNVSQLHSEIELTGTVEGFEVHVGRMRIENQLRTVYTVVVGHAIPFELRRQGFVSFGPDVELGDPQFDRAFRITGREEAIFAALNRSVRKELLSLSRATLADGELECLGGADPSHHTIVYETRRLVALAEALRVGRRSMEAKLFEAFDAELVQEVRRKQLQILLRTVTDPEIKEAALELGLASGDREVRLIAALHAGERGAEALRALAADRQAPDELRARALARTGLQVFGVRALLELRAGADVKLRAAITSRLRDVDEDEGVEAALIAALDDAEEVQLVAVRALAVRGSIAAVEPLTACSQGLMRSPSLKDAARAAVQAIQARISGAERGGLSLADAGDRGALSVAAESGALSKR